MFLSVSEVAERLNVSRATVQAWIDRQYLKAKDLSRQGAANKRWGVTEQWLAEFCDKPTNQPTPKTRRTKRKVTGLLVTKYSHQ